ncbi:MAG: cold-shock protein [Commensalibacter sp.]|nr:cold-shock protein [Commensalibacter sp.]
MKGFGFITPENNDKDIFVHISVLERSGINELNEGQSVIIKVVSGQKGAEAASITLI